MLERKFLFVGKIFLLAFFLINIPNLVPFDFGDSSYWIIIYTTIFDTATLLVLSLSLSKYINLKSLKIVEDLYTQNSNNETFEEKISSLKNKIIQDRKISFIVFIFFLISSVIQPIILIFDINKNDVYSTIVIESINRDFDNKEKNIVDTISMQKKQSIDENEVKSENQINLENQISNLSNIKDKNIEQFLQTNTKRKFNSSKIIIRNTILGLLWAFVFYKLYII